MVTLIPLGVFSMSLCAPPSKSLADADADVCDFPMGSRIRFTRTRPFSFAPAARGWSRPARPCRLLPAQRHYSASVARCQASEPGSSPCHRPSHQPMRARRFLRSHRARIAPPGRLRHARVPPAASGLALVARMVPWTRLPSSGEPHSHLAPRPRVAHECPVVVVHDAAGPVHWVRAGVHRVAHRGVHLASALRVLYGLRPRGRVRQFDSGM